jgi:hypothetical protein
MTAYLRNSLVGLATCLGMGTLPTVASANFDGSYIINPTNFIACTGGSCGTVNISGDGTTAITFDILVTQASLFIHGIEETVAFDVAPNPTSITFASPPTNGAVWSTTLDTTVGQQDGFGSFTDAVNCAGNVAGNLCGTAVEFTLHSASNMTLSAGSTGFLMTIRLASTAGAGATGFGTVTQVPVPAVGAGLPGLIAACGGLLALARRRRQLAA